MKISVIGAGNVGSSLARDLLQEGFGQTILVDKIPGLACAKAFDMQDAQWALKYNYKIEGAEDIGRVKDSDIVVISAGLARKPGMTREELLDKNARIIKDICLQLKKLTPNAILIVVTNPLDLMTYLALKTSGFKPARVVGMGVSLDASRFANLIAAELKIQPSDIEPCVIASHGEGMLPLARFTKVKGVSLDKLMEENKIEELSSQTTNRGAEIVSLLGSGSAYFAPSGAALDIIRNVAKDQKRIQGVCAYLKGEYGLEDICIGVPCRIGKEGIRQIIELELNDAEKAAFLKSAEGIRKNINLLKPYI